MRTVVTVATGAVSKLTVSPSEDEVRIKICEEDMPNKDILLAGIHRIVKSIEVGQQTFRTKIRYEEGKYRLFYYGGRPLVISIQG